MLPVTWLPGVATEIKGHRHFKALITHAHWLKSVEDFRAILLKGWQTCRSAGLRLKTKSRLWVKRCLWITTWLHSGSVYCFDRNAATSLGSSCFLFLLKSAEFSHKVTQNPHACLAWRPSQEISNNQRSLMLFFFGSGTCLKASLRSESLCFFWIYCCRQKVQIHKSILSGKDVMRPDCNVYLQSKGGGRKGRCPPGSQSPATLQVTLAPISPKM